MLCKGAESSVLKKSVDGPIDQTREHVDFYASVSVTTIQLAPHPLVIDLEPHLTWSKNKFCSRPAIVTVSSCLLVFHFPIYSYE